MDGNKELIATLYERRYELGEELRKKQAVVDSCRRDGWSDYEISSTLLHTIEELKASLARIDSWIEREYNKTQGKTK